MRKARGGGGEEAALQPRAPKKKQETHLRDAARGSGGGGELARMARAEPVGNAMSGEHFPAGLRGAARALLCGHAQREARHTKAGGVKLRLCAAAAATTSPR